MSAFVGARKIGTLRADPAVAITIDTAFAPSEVLLIHGRASVTDVEGFVPEYALSQRRHHGEEWAVASLAEIDRPDTRMARIAVRPDRVRVLDLQTRLPGGTEAERFQVRGR